MKATLEFNLPEDSYDMEVAQKGYAFQGALMEFMEWLRVQVKYDHGYNDAELKTFESVRTELINKLEDRDLLPYV